MKFILLIVLFSLSHPLFSQTVDQLNHWPEVLKASRGKTVTMGAWGGSQEINTWLDGKVSEAIKKETGIILKRVPLGDTALAISQLLSDKKINRLSGRYDILWVNGENFKVIDEQTLTWGSFSPKLPHLQKLIDSHESSNLYDFGIEVNGKEAPWGRAIFVLVYDSQIVSTPPKNLEELKKWMIKNPGKFTYPAPPDFVGSAFLRLLMKELNPEAYEKASKGDMKSFDILSKSLEGYLSEIKPYLWKKGAQYPENSSKLHQLYGDGEILMSMGYSPMVAEPFLEKKQFPSKTKTFIFDNGTIGNTHFLTIPFNSPEKLAAAVVINQFLGSQLQLQKLSPKIWGDLPVIDLNRLSQDEQKSFKEMDLGNSVLDLEQLKSASGTELPAMFVPLIEKNWKNNVLRKKI